jgi:hypothetical protein
MEGEDEEVNPQPRSTRANKPAKHGCDDVNALRQMTAATGTPASQDPTTGSKRKPTSKQKYVFSTFCILIFLFT